MLLVVIIHYKILCVLSNIAAACLQLITFKYLLSAGSLSPERSTFVLLAKHRIMIINVNFT
jgi:hypothetical protein